MGHFCAREALLRHDVPHDLLDAADRTAIERAPQFDSDVFRRKPRFNCFPFDMFASLNLKRRDDFVTLDWKASDT